MFRSICELLWSSSMFCDELCAELGLAASNNTWEKMEIAVLLIELVAFFAIMAGIGSKVRRRGLRTEPSPGQVSAPSAIFVRCC